MKIFFFAPYQAIHVHALPQAFLGKTLESEGHEVIWGGCDGFYRSFCIAHAAFLLNENSPTEEKDAICKTCRQSRNAAQKSFSPFLLLENYSRAEDTVEVESLLSRSRMDNLPELEFHGYPIGRIAAYEFLLHHKIFDLKLLTEEKFKLYQSNLALTARTILCAERIFDQNRFDRVLLYNSGYSMNNAVRAVAINRGLPVAFMHGGYNLAHGQDALYLSWQQITEYDRNTIDYFERHHQTMPLNYSKYPMVLDHIRHQLGATSVFTYSSGRTHDLESVYKNLKLGPQYEKVALLTMSSADEAYAADFSIMNSTYLANAKRTFPDQTEWIKANIRYFSERPQDKLIIRVHPREYPNKRENVLSPRTKIYSDLFANLPENIVIDHPDMKNSIYDLFDLVDIHVMAQSTTGAEGARLGLPGIGYVTGLGNYPIAETYPVPRTPQAYFEKMEELLTAPTAFSEERVRLMFEWALFLYTNPVFNFSSHGFWGSGRWVWRKILRRTRQTLGLPRFSVAHYLRSTDITESEKNTLLKFIESTREIHDLREEMEPRHVRTETDFTRYLIGLFAIYYAVPIEKCRKFIDGTVASAVTANAGDCVFLENSDPFRLSFTNENGILKIFLPRLSKSGWFLARLICQRAAIGVQ